MPTLVERFRGCLLGQAVGDALGAPFETMPSEAIYYQFGFMNKIMAVPPVKVLQYTDDTQMMIGIAEVLSERGWIDQAELMRAFVNNFDPLRGYGPGAQRIIQCAADRGDWAALAANIFPGGSLGNGAAMRVAPVGLLFHENLSAVSEQAMQSALPTHRHPIGIDGARILATAIALVVRQPVFNVRQFYADLITAAETTECRDALARASRLTADESIGMLGTSLEVHRSVPTAIACFASSPNSYAAAVGRAIGLGGDTDTIAAMTGALCGAHLGINAIPAHLLGMLEDGAKGRTYIDALANRLHSMLTDAASSS